MRLHCPQCGYALHSLRDCLCSECGEPIQIGSLIQRVKGMRFARRELVLRFISPALIAGGSQIPSIILALGGAPAKVVVGAWVLGVFASFPFSVGLAFVNASELADRLSFLLCVVNGRRQPSRLAMLVRYVGFTLSQLALTVLVLMAASWIAHWIA